ncbi:hypothetical protein AYI68_g2221 [Smittium mucronatum]|uniref:Uncharacterized protein n=1 Tax=Smittium mucronatum TaxID=133383 RepID=A0A1R0H3D8_9FUNG|nr:hypothetical protein AYI68_g2221 [Smittium mucronatum]
MEQENELVNILKSLAVSIKSTFQNELRDLNKNPSGVPNKWSQKGSKTEISNIKDSAEEVISIDQMAAASKTSHVINPPSKKIKDDNGKSTLNSISKSEKFVNHISNEQTSLLLKLKRKIFLGNSFENSNVLKVNSFQTVFLDCDKNLK